MNLRTPYSYSIIKNKIPYKYHSLACSINTDVAIIGAGISGALTAWHLHKEGYSCTILDKHHVGMGSTAASTSLLQYETDKSLIELTRLYGERNAVHAYHLGIEAIDEIGKICSEVNLKNSFQKCQSMQFASYKNHVSKLLEEYNLRTKNGFNVELLYPTDIESQYNFKAPLAIESQDAAQVDVYLLTHEILHLLHRKNMNVFTNTEILKIHFNNKQVLLHTNNNFTIKAKYLVIACGYESQKYLKQNVEKLRTTYALITKPISEEKLWKNKGLIWETADPYLYLKIENDNRVIVGGKDSDFISKINTVPNIKQKSLALIKTLNRLFPNMHPIIDSAWAGIFSTTKDGLPYIGSVSYLPKTYFALGFGGNGITFSAIAARYIAKMLKGQNITKENIFSFDRKPMA